MTTICQSLDIRIESNFLCSLGMRLVDSVAAVLLLWLITQCKGRLVFPGSNSLNNPGENSTIVYSITIIYCG